MSECWFLNSPFTAIIGGKWGDCVQMTGAFHAVAERTGHPVNVVCSATYASAFEGCSFVNAVPVDTHWSEGMENMKAVAQAQFGGGTVLQWWNDATSPEFNNKQGGISLQIHGKTFKVDTAKEPNYSASMLSRTGFSWSEAMELRPVFDMRNPAREAGLLGRCWPMTFRHKPLLLVAFDGQSSPWGYLPEFYPMLRPFHRQFHIVDLSKLRCHRVYDMLVLMENAVGLITVDTLALHLVAATDLPYCAFTQNAWCGSVPKGNCVLSISYGETIRRLPEVLKLLEGWARATKPSMLVSQDR